jgi:hypothetical protein
LPADCLVVWCACRRASACIFIRGCYSYCRLLSRKPSFFGEARFRPTLKVETREAQSLRKTVERQHRKLGIANEIGRGNAGDPPTTSLSCGYHCRNFSCPSSREVSRHSHKVLASRGSRRHIGSLLLYRLPASLLLIAVALWSPGRYGKTVSSSVQFGTAYLAHCMADQCVIAL